jgi:hypothetical protein
LPGRFFTSTTSSFFETDERRRPSKRSETSVLKPGSSLARPVVRIRNR